ncbi:hypothetical protein [Pseudogulbenkiania sp. MAI-1]|uniref:COG4315 family predicted lipoprotein n=1 Tax=Pseudogulbenkiania sp. MAI-1 TaxID=990370 RepID=UPI00045E7984|nr:hypothetical protein [Pseudogulbenkiania sp. MAI-1]
MSRLYALPGLCALLLATQTLAGQPPAAFHNGVLADSTGMTLYVFNKDVSADGRSVCNGQCAALWPPLAAAEQDKAYDDFSIITRDDGSKQWAWRGKPLYRFAQDQAPGEQKGEGVKQLWSVVKP